MEPLIAIVEDNARIQELLDVVLTRARYKTLSIDPSLELLTQLTAQLPDVVLLDVSTKDVATGWELLNRIRQHRPTRQIPVVLCSGNVPSLLAYQDQLRELNCDILPKPYTADELLAGIGAAIQRTSRPIAT